MIILKFEGGLVSNLYQIANSLDFLKKYNIDINNFKILKEFGYGYNEKNFPNQNKDLIFKEILSLFIDNKEFFDKYKNNITNIINYKNNIVDNFNMNDFNINNNYILNHNYLLNHKFIYDFFNIKDKQKELIKKYNFDVKNTLCIHIRRNDYIQTGYYLKDFEILNYVNNNIDRKIWICTDDIKYCRKILFNYKKINYFYDLNLNVDEELILGGCCINVLGTKFSSYSRMLKYFSKYLYNKNNKIEY